MLGHEENLARKGLRDSEMSLETRSPRPRVALSTLQGRITAVAMLTAVAVLLAACAVFTAEQWRSERQSFMRAQADWAEALAAGLGRSLARHDVQHAHLQLASLRLSPSVKRAALVDTKGQVIDSYVSADPKVAPHASMVETRTAVYAAGQRVGDFVMVRQEMMMDQFLVRCLAVTAALFFAAAGLSLFLGRWLAKRVVEPIDRLAAGMREVAQSSDFARRVEPMAHDELGRLTGCFNDLLEQLKTNDGALRHTLGELTHARDAAEAANVQKSQFLANMSHEIRTPLNGVLAMAQIMAIGDLADEQRERLTVIHKSGEALLDILNDILDVSKIEAGKLELDPVEFEAGDVLRAVRDGLAGMAEKKGLTLDLDLAPDAAGVRVGDAARLRQILSNLISKALKFTSVGGVVIMARGLGEGGAAGLLLSVRDTGIGVPAEKMTMLFQKFTQLDASTTRRFGGTGLGLAICHELASLMGGRVWAESVEGQGSTFHVELPLARMAGAPRTGSLGAADDGPEAEGGALRVLAAEDNPTNQMVLSTILQIFGADLQLVGDGAAAVEAWECGEYDVVLMDVQMPVMDGVAATREIRRREAEQNRPRTPIIALSANAMIHQVKEYTAAGMDGHVAKPIELPKLHAALEAVLTARTAASEQVA